ncbi:MAG: serine hydrolase domain-containing protein [Bacteroidota bacterium]
MFKQFVLLFFLSFSLTGMSSFAQTTYEKAHLLFDRFVPDQGPGLTTLVIKGEDILFQKHAGLANLEHQIPITDSTRFLVASISKQFTAYAILLLQDAGKLSLDDPITTYLPELEALGRIITIRQLANHTNGFRNNTELNGLRMRTGQEPITHQEMVQILLRQRGLNFEPGKRFQYHNAGYVLLAEIVQRVSGQPFAEFIETHIFNPLNMTNSVFKDDPTLIIPNRADSYIEYTDGFHCMAMDGSLIGSTGLYTTTKDLAIWTHHFLHSTPKAATIYAQMIASSQLNSGVEIPYGLGVETKTYRGEKVVFHGGGDAGFRSYLLYVPEHDVTIVVSGNYESFNPLDIAFGMLDLFLLEELDLEPDQPAPQLTPNQIVKFVGTYQIFPGFYINIVSRQDSLFYQSFIDLTEMLYLPAINDTTFNFRGRAHSRMVFSKDKLVWHFSDFHYPGQRVLVDPPTYADLTLSDYPGSYYSDELESIFTFYQEDGQLFVRYPFQPDLVLMPIDQDVFITNSGLLSRMEFVRDDQDKIIHCRISGQDAYDILFRKVNLD